MRIFIAGCLSLFLMVAINATTCTWIGESGNWSSKRNWADGRVPTGADTAVLPATQVPRIIVIDRAAAVESLRIEQEQGTATTLRLDANLSLGAFEMETPGDDLLDLHGHTLTLKTGTATPWLIGDGTIIKTGSETARLCNKAFTGFIDVAEGTLDQQNTDLSSAARITVHAGAMLIGFPGDPLPREVYLRGNGINEQGAYRCESRAWGTVWQPITLEADTTLDTGHADLRVSQIDGIGSLVKTGRGRLLLLGANSYSGLTIVREGELHLNGSVLGGVVLTSATALSGAGTIGGYLWLATGCRLNPGTDYAPGKLTASNLRVNSLTYQWEIADADGEEGVGWSMLEIQHALTFANEPISIEITAADPTMPITNFDPTQPYAWTIIHADAISGFRPAMVSLVTNRLKDDLHGGSFGIVERDGDIQLTFTPGHQ